MKKNTMWIILGIFVIGYLIYAVSSRNAAADVTRTFQKTTGVKVNEQVKVTVTGGGATLLGNTYWIMEMPLPTGWTFTPSSITATNMGVYNGIIKFWGNGPQTGYFYVTPTSKMTSTSFTGLYYHPIDDKVYVWDTVLTTCSALYSSCAIAGPSTVVTMDCMTIAEVLTYLPRWVQGTVTTPQMITYLKQLVQNSC